MFNHYIIMKKILIVAGLATFVFACTHKAMPTTSSTNTTNPGSASTTTTASTTATTSSTNTSSNAALVEQGHAVYLDKTKCARCHGPKDVTAYTQERWTGILRNMIPKAKLDETQSAQVTAYVMANAKK